MTITTYEDDDEDRLSYCRGTQFEAIDEKALDNVIRKIELKKVLARENRKYSADAKTSFRTLATSK